MLSKIFRIIIGIGLAYGLIHFTLKSTGGDIWKEILRAQKSFLLLSLLFYGTTICITIYRWNLLLKVQGVYLRVWDLIRLTMIGGFFNLVIPGAVSGDLVKMIFLAKQTKRNSTEAVLTVILDRTLGMIGLFIIAAIMVLLYLPFLLNLKHEYRFIQVATLTVGLVSICGVFGVALIKFRQTLKRYLGINRIVKYAERKLPKSMVLALIRVMNALYLYRQNLGAIAIGIALSILIHSCLAVNLFLVGVSIGENVIQLSDYFLATQVSSAITIIPLTPGGVGMRDVTTTILFSALHASPEKIAVLPVIMTLIMVFWRLIGGLFFIFSMFPKAAVQSAVVVNHKSSAPKRLEAE